MWGLETIKSLEDKRREEKPSTEEVKEDIQAMSVYLKQEFFEWEADPNYLSSSQKKQKKDYKGYRFCNNKEFFVTYNIPFTVKKHLSIETQIPIEEFKILRKYLYSLCENKALDEVIKQKQEDERNYRVKEAQKHLRAKMIIKPL